MSNFFEIYHETQTQTSKSHVAAVSLEQFFPPIELLMYRIICQIVLIFLARKRLKITHKASYMHNGDRQTDREISLSQWSPLPTSWGGRL